MPVIIDNDQYQVIETVTSNGKTLQFVFKAGSLGANQQTLFANARTAIAANSTYLALANPTAAQNTAQIKRLTREANALIRLLLGELQDVSDT